MPLEKTQYLIDVALSGQEDKSMEDHEDRLPLNALEIMNLRSELEKSRILVRARGEKLGRSTEVSFPVENLGIMHAGAEFVEKPESDTNYLYLDFETLTGIARFTLFFDQTFSFSIEAEGTGLLLIEDRLENIKKGQAKIVSEIIGALSQGARESQTH